MAGHKKRARRRGLVLCRRRLSLVLSSPLALALSSSDSHSPFTQGSRLRRPPNVVQSSPPKASGAATPTGSSRPPTLSSSTSSTPPSDLEDRRLGDGEADDGSMAGSSPAWRSAARAAGGELLPGGAGGRIRAEGGRSRGELERRREEPSGGGADELSAREETARETEGVEEGKKPLVLKY